MKQLGLRPRVAPLLKNFFGLASIETQLYAAPLIDPLGEALERRMAYTRGEDGPPQPQKIDHAYRNNNGDVFFSFDLFRWYVLPQGSREAFRLGEGSASSSGILTAAFNHELTGKMIGVLKADLKQGIAAIACCLDQGPDRTTYTEQLERLAAQEFDALTQAVRSRKISFIGIPEIRALEGVFRKQNGSLLVVSCNRSDYSYDALRVFSGPTMQELKEIPVAKVERFRDGGSTFFYTERGILYSPAGNDSLTISPKWKKGCSYELGQDLRKWREDTFDAEQITRLKVSDMSAEVNDDPRLIGCLPWVNVPKTSLIS